MANKRDRVIKYIENAGIELNIGKNKARGNKGFFKVRNGNYRIDISRIINEEDILRVLAHEFMHYVHYTYDKDLKTLNFIFENNEDRYLEELLSVTVDLIPKKSIKPLFDYESDLIDEIKNLKGKHDIVSKLNLSVKEKLLNRVRAKISRINRYYNQPSELLARSYELYLFDREKMKIIAPLLYTKYETIIESDTIPILTGFTKIYDE